MDNQMIVVKQLPIIEEHLKKVSEEVNQKVNKATSLVCTEENVKTIKEVRASLNKEAKDWEERRKAVKSKIMKPYEDFEKIYKECIGDKYRNAETILKDKITSVEDELKEKKKTEIESYFNEYLESKGIDFVTFNKANINITLSASMKSLKEQAKTFIDKISDDLALIDRQEHKAEILVEYKQSLNVSQAITTVSNRFKAIEEEKKKEEQKTMENHVPTIEEVEQVQFENEATKTNEILTSVDKQLEQPIEEKTEELATVTFKVTAPISKLKVLKQFLVDGGYTYE